MDFLQLGRAPRSDTLADAQPDRRSRRQASRSPGTIVSPPLGPHRRLGALIRPPKHRRSPSWPAHAISCVSAFLFGIGEAAADAYQIDVGVSECGRVATWSDGSPVLIDSSVRGNWMTMSFVVNDDMARTGGATDVVTEDILWSATPTPTPPKIGERTTTTARSEFANAVASAQVGFSGGATATVPVASLHATREETERQVFDGNGVLQSEWIISDEEWRVDLDLTAPSATHTVPPVFASVAGNNSALDLTHITLAVDGRWNQTALYAESPPELVVPDLTQLLGDDEIKATVNLRFDHTGPPAHAVYVCSVATMYVPEPSVALGLGLGSLALAALARRRAGRTG